ncbi:MAG: PAS domain-containing protein [Burkholderiales bacterium]|nr:PAS domain-containing protein [Burkholderiales bacterium]
MTATAPGAADGGTGDPMHGLDAAALRELAVLAVDWVWEQDADLRFVAITPSYHGRPADPTYDVVGRTRWELPLVGVSDAQWRDHRGALARREPFRDFEFGRHDADGTLRWFTVSGHPLFGPDGAFTGYRGIGREITARRNAERALAEREAQLFLVTENVPAAIGYIDRDWVLRFANRGFRELFGHFAGARVGLHLRTGMGEAVFARVRPHFERVFAGQPVAYQRPDTDAGGLPRTLAVRLVPHRDERGAVRGCYSLTVDITAQQEAETKIRELERLFASALENTTDLMAVYRVEGDDLLIGEFNRAMRVFYEERFAGVRVEAWIGRSIDVFLREVGGLDAAARERRLAPFRRAAATAQPQRYRSAIESPTGLQHRDALLVPITGADGRTTHLFYRGADITSLVQKEAELGRLNSDLERMVAERTAGMAAAMQELESFAYAVSHDLRAPLRGIDGFATLLAEAHGHTLGIEGMEHLERIRTSIGRMAALIDALLRLSRVTRSPLLREAVDASAMAAGLLTELQRQEAGRGVEWRVQPGVRCVADPGLLRAVLENLLGNAWKYTRKAARPVVEFGAVRDAHGTEIFVRDNGAGFEMAYVDKLFEPFQRLHTLAEFEGTGIGLATVARIALRHGGRVRAVGAPGQGATFFVYFPD